MRDAKGRAEAGVVDELAGVLREDAEEARHLAEAIDLSEVAHVALHDGAHVVEMPLLAAGPRSAFQGLRVTAREDGGDERGAGDPGAGFGRATAEGLGEKHRGRAAQLGGREREEVDGRHAAGEGIGDPRERHEIGGASEKEAAGAAVGVHALLDGEEHLGRALDFVDHGAVEAADEAHGIALRGGERGGVVEREERAAVGGEVLREGGFAGLARAGEEHDPSVRQRGLDAALDEAGVHGGRWNAARQAPD